MDIQALKAKYKDQRVSVIPSRMIQSYPQYGFMSSVAWGKHGKDNVPYTPIYWHEVNSLLESAIGMYRYEAELNEMYKQVIPYTVIYNPANKKIFCTKRLAGDERLKGQVSIGTGGHMDEGEQLTQTMFRELKEEVGLEDNEANSYKFIGLILDDSTEVSRVHIGFVMLLEYKEGTIEVKETEKLQGAWMIAEEIAKEPKLESWSRILLPYVSE